MANGRINYYDVIEALVQIRARLTNFESSIDDSWRQYGKVLESFGKLNQQSADRLDQEKAVTEINKNKVKNQIASYKEEVNRLIRIIEGIIGRH